MTPDAGRTPARPAWAQVDLDAIAFNVRQIRSIAGAGAKVFICLKCDAFGCGAVQVAQVAQRAGAHGLAFGDVDLAFACREAGVDLPILLYPSCLPQSAPRLARERLMPTVSTLEDARAWDEAADRELQVFLKIDGGALRAGAFAHDAAAVAQAIHSSRHLRLAGAYGHLIAYGLDDPRYEAAQIAHIQSAFAAVAATGPLPIRMLSSSESFLKYPALDGDAVEPGRLAFGLAFPAAPGRERTWRPALTRIASRLVMVRDLDVHPDMLPVPYFELRPGMRIGLIPVGWDSGLPRTLPAAPCALVRGKRVRLLPPVHAELTRVDLTDVPDARVGDELVLFGGEGAGAIGMTEFSAMWNLGETALYTGLAARLPKRYTCSHDEVTA
jgi:alanine racemase